MAYTKTKTIEFDATESSIIPNTNRYFHAELETPFPDEVLANFTPDEIIQYYEDLDELYLKLKEHFKE